MTRAHEIQQCIADLEPSLECALLTFKLVEEREGEEEAVLEMARALAVWPRDTLAATLSVALLRIAGGGL